MAIDREALERAGYVEGIGCWWKDVRDGAGNRLYTLELDRGEITQDWACQAVLRPGGRDAFLRLFRVQAEPLDAIEAWFAMAYDRLECEPIGAEDGAPGRRRGGASR